MDTAALESIAKAMVAPGKGILAIDESHATCEKRFKLVGVEFSEEMRRQYRQLLITAPGIEESIAGMILFDETIRQKTDDGTAFVDVFKEKGMIPGIKVDTGAKDLALHPGEKVTEGLDGLRDRLAEYSELGAQFAKWRSVITIQGNELPSEACYMANAHATARYAALVQEAGMVPMVEPEILLDGDHTIERCYEVCTQSWRAFIEQLQEQGVHLPGTILKTSMILSGKDCAEQADLQTVAQQTVKGLTENVPAEIAGVVFLSGGQSADESTVRLDAMNKIGGLPWPLSFSYGRGIQQPALDLWAQDTGGNVEAAQKILVHRANMNGLASKGEYSAEAENA